MNSWRSGLVVLLIALLGGLFLARFLRQGDGQPDLLSLSRPAMGTLVDVQVLAGGDGAAEAIQAALDEAARVDSLFSWRLPPPVAMSSGERRWLLDVGLEVQLASSGAFDPRLRPLISAWGFDGGTPRVPESTVIADLLVRLQEPGLPAGVDDPELDFGAWAKGYAVDRALAVLRDRHQPAGLVNAGGEVRGYGREWTVGVQHPRMPGALLVELRPGNLAVATSGDYEQFFEQDGRRYHHLLDPRTGYPARGCQSVTVLAPTCARADALATAVFVLGPDAGMDLVESLPNVECLIIDATGDRHDSSGLSEYWRI